MSNQQKIQLATKVPPQISEWQRLRDQNVERLGEELFDMWDSGLNRTLHLGALNFNDIVVAWEVHIGKFDEFDPYMWMVRTQQNDLFLILANSTAYTGWEVDCFARAYLCNYKHAMWYQVKGFLVDMFGILLFDEYYYNKAKFLLEDLLSKAGKKYDNVKEPPPLPLGTSNS